MEKVGKVDVGSCGGGLKVQDGFVALLGCIGCIGGKELIAFVGCIGAKALKPLAIVLGVPEVAGFRAVKALRVWSGVMAREDGWVEKAPVLDKAGVLRWFWF